MQIKVSGETPFKVMKDTCSIGPSASGYTLNYAVKADGPWTAWSEATPADEVCIVNGLTPYMYLKLAGNSGEVDVIV